MSLQADSNFLILNQSLIAHDRKANQALIGAAFAGCASIALLAAALFVIISNQSHLLATLLPSGGLGLVTICALTAYAYHNHKKNEYIQRVARNIISPTSA